MSDWTKPKPTDGIVSRYINRRVSVRITKALVSMGAPLSPDAMSVIAAAMGVIAAALIALGFNVAGGVLVQLSSILDGVDGELARALGRTTKRGGFFDAILDRYVDIAVVAGLALFSLRLGADPFLVLVACLAALSGDLMVSYIHARGEATLGVHPALLGRLRGFATRDVRLLVASIAALISMPLEGLIVIAIVSHFYAVAKTLEVLATYRG